MNKQTEIEAAVFRRLIKHLDNNKDVQNIDLMILADFCRNGMPYSEWKDKYQLKATPEQMAALEAKKS